MRNLAINLAALWLQSGLVLAMASVAAVLLRKRSAALRHVIWASALASLLLLPVVRMAAPVWQAPMERISPALAAPLRTVLTVTAEDPAKSDGVAWDRLLAAIWLMGAAGFAVRMGRAYAAAGRLKRDATAADGGVLISEALATPMVCGVLEPRIILPSGAPHWGAERLRVVLSHESMHLLRRDTLVQFVAQLACVVFWPQPLVWIATRRMRAECEQACDDGVLVQGETASAYAGHLIEMVRGLTRIEPATEGGIAMAQKTDFERRLRALLHPDVDRRSAGPRSVTAAMLTALFLTMGIAGMRAPAFAQSGQLSGVVKDPSGAVVPKARITISQSPETIDFREIVYSNDAGEFAIQGLKDGEYNLSIAKPGFARTELKGVSYNAANPMVLNVTLNIGKVSETLTVKGEGAPAKAATSPAQTPTRIRVGGNVQATKIVHKVNPMYPPDAKAERAQGTVLLKAVIGKDGAPLNIEQINKQVDARLVQAAMDALRQWRWEPTLLNGQPVEVITEIEINFTLMP